MHVSVASSACHLTTGPSVDWRAPKPVPAPAPAVNGRAKDDDVCGRSTSGWSSPAPDTVGDESLSDAGVGQWAQEAGVNEMWAGVGVGEWEYSRGRDKVK